MATTATFRLTNRSDRPLVFSQDGNTFVLPIVVPPASEGVPGSVNLVILGIEDRSARDSLLEPGFKAAIDAGELVVESTASVRLKNTSAQALTLFQGRRATLTVPPASEAPDGVELLLTTAERTACERVFATPAIQRWIATGVLVVDDDAPISA